MKIPTCLTGYPNHCLAELILAGYFVGKAKKKIDFIRTLSYVGFDTVSLTFDLL